MDASPNITLIRCEAAERFSSGKTFLKRGTSNGIQISFMKVFPLIEVQLFQCRNGFI